MLTIHRSKGLEFPIVYCPYLWEPGYIPRGRPARSSSTTPTRATRGRSTSALDGPRLRAPPAAAPASSSAARTCGSPTSRSRARSTRRSSGGRARGTAATRALGAAAVRARRRRQRAPAGGATPPTTPRRRALRGSSPRERAGLHQRRALDARRCRPRWSDPPREPAELAAARFDRALDWRWRRTSYSDITAGTYEARVASEPEEAVVDDEPRRSRGAAAVAGRADEAAALRGTSRRCWPRCRSASHVGTFVHRVLEATDFAARRPRRRARRRASPRRRRGASVDLGDPARRRAPGCARRSRRRSAPLLGGLRLRDVARADRLDELSFELPLAGGDEPTGRARRSPRSPPCCASTCRRATRSPATPSGSTTRRCASTVRGYLTGSIDLVVRVRGADGAPRFAVVDYKTNWLARARTRTLTRVAPPPGRARRRDAARATTGCRRCSTRSRCTATCAGACPATTPSATSPASSTCSCAG